MSNTINITNPQNNDWTASFILSSSEANSYVSFSIFADDLDPIYYATTDNSYVLVNNPLPTPTSSATSSNHQQSSNPVYTQDYSCHSHKPLFSPDLFEIRTTLNSAKLYFTPLIDTSNFYVSFSPKSNAEEHGELVTLIREGVQSHNIYYLKPNTTYYVKVRGQNGCMPGDWSNTMKFKTNYQTYYKNYFPTKKFLPIIFRPTPTTVPKITVTPIQSNTSPQVSKKCFLWWCW